jgi:hypothetical protein
MTSGFDKAVAEVKSQTTTTVTAATSTLMVLSAPQAFVLMKIFQSLDFYVFLTSSYQPTSWPSFNCSRPTFLDFMPNFCEKLASDDGFGKGKVL